MKPSTPSSKGNSSTVKNKRNSKEREKRKSLGGAVEVNNHNAIEKGSPSKESNSRLYAGIDSECLLNYAEQTSINRLSEEITNTLTEDINYRLRYIINDALISSRLSGRNTICADDLEEAFENLKIEKVYGATSQPNWVAIADQNLFCLDDNIINLVEIASEENVYYQYSEPILTTKWIPEQKEISKPLKNYFTTMCQQLVGNDLEVRRMALVNIGENCRIGPLTEWFYNFGYILLSKDITYDSLTMRALDLITTLEKSSICRINVSKRQLRLLVRLILQRLLKTAITNEVLKPICKTLALLCLRDPLKEFVILKILQKINEVFQNYALSIATTANSLGIDAIQRITLPHLHLFLHRLEKREASYIYSMLETYYILCKENQLDSEIYETFNEYFGDVLIIFNEVPRISTKLLLRKDINFAHVKCDLMQTRRKIPPRRKSTNRLSIEDVFDMPPQQSKVGKKIKEASRGSPRSETNVTVGKTTLLLPVFKQKHKKCSKCQDHTLAWYNL